MVWGAIAGAALGGVVDGIFGKKSQDKQIDAQREANAANAALQREFAMNGIRWQVKQARQEGLHPLAVLGAQQIAASPSYVAAEPANAYQNVGKRIGDAFAQMQLVQGENETRKQALEIERMDLQNSLLREEARMVRQQTNDIVGFRPYNRDALILDNRGKLLYNVDRQMELRLKEHELREKKKGKKGTRGNPHRLFQYYRDQYSGKIFVAPNTEYSEGMEGAAGKAVGVYGQGREAMR